MAIPQNAKKVFEGVIFDVYHWEQEQFDGTFKTFEMVRHMDVAIVIPLVGDLIYISHQEQPNEAKFTGLPAGRFDRGETDPIAVAKRELLEETGYASDDLRIFHSNHHVGNVEFTSHIIVAHDCKKVAEPRTDPGERSHGNMLVTFDELLELSTQPDFRRGELEMDYVKALLDPIHKENFRKQIFGV